MDPSSNVPTNDGRLAVTSVVPTVSGAGAVLSPTKSKGGSGRSSRKSTMSATKTKIEADMTKKIFELKGTLESKKKVMKQHDINLRKCERKLKALAAMHESPEWDAEKKEEERKLMKERDVYEDAYEETKIEVEYLENTYKDQAAVIQIDAKYEMELVDSEGDDSYASYSEDEEKQERTKKWTEEAATKNVSFQEDKKTETEVLVTTQRVFDTENEPNDRPYIDAGGARAYPMSYVARETKKVQEYNAALSKSQQKQEHQSYRKTDDHHKQSWKPQQQAAKQWFPPNQPSYVNTYGRQSGYQSYNTQQPAAATTANNSNDNVVNQLVAALGQAFCGGQRDVIVKAPVDKDLPKFNGSPAKWETFRSEYERTTRRYKYEDCDNLTRLHKALEGDAKAAVEHLLTSPRNLDKIWETLEKRFGRPEFILEYLVEKARTVKSPDENKPETLIAFGTAIEALVTNVCSFNQQDYLLNKQLANEFVAKLTPNMRTNWYEWLTDDNKRKSDLYHFDKWLSRKVNAAILSVKPKMDSAEEEKRRPKRGPGGIHAANGEEKENANSCLYCDKDNHTTTSCWKFKKCSVSQRWDFVKEKKLCVSCLQPNHRSRTCKEAAYCPKEGCSRQHHVLLHKDIMKKDKIEEKVEKTVDDKPKAEGAMNAALIEGCDGPLAIIPIKIKGPNGNKRVYAFLDGGASKSLITKRLAADLGLEGEKEDYSFRGIKGELITVKNAMTVNCSVSGVYRGASYHTVYSTKTVDEIPLNKYSINVDEIKRRYPYLKRAKCGNLKNVKPDIIIGNNNPHIILHREVLRRNDEDPVAWRSVLGWTISGNFDSLLEAGSMNALVGMEMDDYLHNLIKDSFTLENHGIMVPKSKGINADEKRAYNILENTTKQNNGYWETGLLWKADNVILPESEKDVYRRLLSQESRMRKDPQLAELYCAKFDEYLKKGYLEKLSPKEAAVKTHRTWYIPHFGVTNVNKPGKLRLVFDAAAKSNGVSLNDHLLKGPDLIRPLAAVLWNFRKYAIALTGDITDMFHRVHVQNQDRDSQRLLWRGGDQSKVPEHYKMNVLIFGATSSPSSAIYIKNRNAQLYEEDYPEAAKVIVDQFYVDDNLVSVKTVKDAIRLREQITFICAKAGMTVCKWTSNSQQVIASIPSDLRADGVKTLEEKSSIPTERVLGMWWNPTEDIFTFRVNIHKVSKEILDGKQPTKREIARLVMSVFDPIGFVNHFKVKGLIILQEVWRTGIGWDDEVPSDIHEKWLIWVRMLNQITEVRIPRVYAADLDESDSLEMHTFVDSSEESMCALCYLRAQTGNYVEVSFLSSKVRVAPLRKTTIPRLELQAALLGARLANSLQEELKLKLTSRYFWSDSKTVLCWIRASAIKYKEFVANRVGEIQETTDVMEWKWIPTSINVADIGTRFGGEISFTPDFQWFRGPEFLYGPAENYPKEKQQEESVISAAVGEITNVTTPADSKKTLPVWKRYSNYYRMLRASAAVKKAALFWKGKVFGGTEETAPWSMVFKKLQSHITSADMEEAERQLIIVVQEEAFPEDMKALRNGIGVPKNSKLAKLSPIIHGGIIKIRSRIMGASNIEDDTRLPIILPAKHAFTDLLVDSEHRANAHQEVETVLSNLRKRFWILDGRQTMKSAFARCQKCKLQRAKPIVPEMGDIPQFRLASHQLPFSFTGLDFFGPLEVAVGRRREKRWGMLLCCMVTRAIHLEVAHGLSTDEVMMGLSRFIDTRGRPKLIICDNGTNFVGAANEMQRELMEVDFDTIAVNGKFHPIQWRFNPPSAPHFGGAWERLVQSVKKCLYNILCEKHPRDTTLLTTLKSVEYIINSRPITHISTDHTDPEALTPNHLLRGGCDSGPEIPANVEPSAEFLRAQWKRANLFAEQFWQRWTCEYLPKLQRREKWHSQVESLEVGDLVFLVNENTPRNSWSRGVISKTFPGADGQVRVVEVIIADAAGKKTTLKRPVVKVCPLGLRMKMQG